MKFTRITDGTGTLDDLQALEDVAVSLKNGSLCALDKRLQTQFIYNEAFP